MLGEAQGSAPSPPGRSAIRVLALVLAGIAALAFFTRLPSREHRIHVTVYFSNSMGLKPGAPVRQAGVDIGTIQSVRLHPERKEEPVEAKLLLSTAYEMGVPNDSVVRLTTAGVLGERFADVDSRNAKGPPIRDGAVLRSEPFSECVCVPPEALKLVEKTLGDLSEKCAAAAGARAGK